MLLNRPYFMSNEDWYYYDYDKKIYKLTDKATKEAKNSYEEYYKILNSQYMNNKESEV